MKWCDMFLCSWERMFNLLEKRKSKQQENKQQKYAQNKKHTFGHWLKHDNYQVTLLYAILNLEFGEIPSIWKWKFSSYLKEICKIHGMSLNKCTMISQTMQPNRKVSKNRQAKLKMSTYLEIKEPNVEEKEVEMRDSYPNLNSPNSFWLFQSLQMWSSNVKYMMCSYM